MPTFFEDLKNEFGKSADYVAQKVAEFSDAAKDQVELLDLKKDRYLKHKELGELTFQLISKEHKINVEEDVQIKVLVNAIETINRKIESLEKTLPEKK